MKSSTIHPYPLHTIVWWWAFSAYIPGLCQLPLLLCLVSLHNANIDLYNNSGLTPLMIVVQQGEQTSCDVSPVSMVTRGAHDFQPLSPSPLGVESWSGQKISCWEVLQLTYVAYVVLPIYANILIFIHVVMWCLPLPVKAGHHMTLKVSVWLKK